MKIVLSLLMLLAGIPAALAVPPKACRVVTDTIRSQVLGSERVFTVCLPPGYDKDKHTSYPVLYLLHGLGGTHDDWQKNARVASVASLMASAGEADPMIIVMPDAGGDPDVKQNGYFNIPGWAYEDFFFEEFLPEVERRYRVIGDRRHRAIAGLSMGGGGSIVYAQHHPELFGSVYAMSALIRLRDPNWSNAPKGSPRDKMLRSVTANDCLAFLNNADSSALEPLRDIDWMIDCGDDDFLLDRNVEFFGKMRDLRIPCQLRVRDGYHNWEYWHDCLRTLFPFVSRSFAGRGQASLSDFYTTNIHTSLL